jgi:hypothetical protein
MTKFNPSEYVQQNRIPMPDAAVGRFAQSHRLVCKDGFTMSVQASPTHYCSPKTCEGPWTTFEVGFPSAHEPLLREHAEEPDDMTDTVCGYVPADLVAEIVAKHGGVKS